MSTTDRKDWYEFVPVYLGNFTNWPYGQTKQPPVYDYARKYGFLMDSKHAYRKSLRSYDGGSLYLYKEEQIITPSSPIRVFHPDGGLLYEGAFSTWREYPSHWLYTFSHNANDFVAEAWNRGRPAKPDFSGLNAAYELREVPALLRESFHSLFSAIKGVRPTKLSQAGEFHLALQFGWLPLLSDVQNFISTYRNHEKIVDQLMRDNGKAVRRSGTLHKDSDSFTVPRVGEQFVSPYLVNQAYMGGFLGEVQYNAHQEIRYSGRFRYWLPPGPGTFEWKREILRRIYGFRLTPTVVYNAIPWSWLFNWFTNLGELIQTISPGVEDRLAADYLYVTTYNTCESNATMRGNFRTSPQGATSAIECRTVYRFKEIMRVDGGSFLPELAGNTNLSAMQAAILAAIGAQRYGT